MKPWKRGRLDDQAARLKELQWGHGDEAVEEYRAFVRDQIRSRRLQWGHGDEAVEEF